ncbi:hypothetical protein E1218_32340 [Kribbella turkmenica]|uniref:Uncharacterized protein n=1 Tax=Kribbella turkmenica TaxID=2530375 RepID=A0A4R4WF48_9ACTN|nr:hypothetical protein [Kribbella turkmenica]TDD14883.1 hypothetical protein E1218_32340 [Kribbella turkmenica]
MNSSPQIPGYQFDHRLLTHPLAELWRGRSFTGMAVVALVLSDAGARDEVVRDRLVRAGRGAALEPGQQETPLWAANFTAGRPYAITQLVSGQTGAERLIDPLDGILGNDEDALQAVRSELSQYGARPPEDSEFPSYAEPKSTTEQPQPTHPTAVQQPPTQVARPQRSKVALAREYRHKIGGWIYVVSTLGVLVVFSVTYSIGSAIGSSVKDEPAEAVPAAVSPPPFPSPALLPGIERITTAEYKEPDGAPGVVGATFPAGTDVQPIVNAGFPFAFGWPQPPELTSLGESSTAVYRQVVTKTPEYRPRATLQARIALHQCDDLAACLAGRATVDAAWTKAFNAPAPTAAKDARTWFAEQRSEQKAKAYTLTMSHVFLSGGRWWLVGVAAKGATGEDKAVQQIVNDIWRQTG